MYRARRFVTILHSPGAPTAAGVLAAATLLDAATTSLGLGLGLEEQGPLASILLPELGPLYWPLQHAALWGAALLIRAAGLPWAAAAPLAALGPLAAGLVNAALILGRLGVA